MNIFILSEDPVVAAQMQCDKHVVKMITESAQMLSTAHRYLDGNVTKRRSRSGKRIIDHWEHPNETLYKVVHLNHPCTQWTIECSANYMWHYNHFKALAEEYTHRYGKIHASWNLLGKFLQNIPDNIPKTENITPFRLAMGDTPEFNNPKNPVESYRRFYESKQNRFKMTWKKRNIPYWFNKCLVDITVPI